MTTKTAGTETERAPVMRLQFSAKCDTCGEGMSAGEEFWWGTKGGGYGFRTARSAPERQRPMHAFDCMKVAELQRDLAQHDATLNDFLAQCPEDIRGAAERAMNAKRARIAADLDATTPPRKRQTTGRSALRVGAVDGKEF